MDKYRLREVREEYNDILRGNKKEITIEHMAKVCGAGKSTISRIEKGKTEPPPNVLIGYADTFGVTVDYLIRRSNAKNPEHSVVSNELGLTDKAIETLKLIKEKAAYEDYDISAFINAFIGSGTATFDLFDGLFNKMSAEYVFSKYNPQTSREKQMYSDKLAKDMTDMIQEYIKYQVQPQLQRVIENCYQALKRNESYTYNQSATGAERQE